MKKPLKEELLDYVNDKQAASEKFDVNIRTVYRWMQSYRMIPSKENFGPKLTKDLANELRKKSCNGKCVKELAEEYGITLAATYRIINKSTYKEVSKDTAQISAIYKV